MNESDIVTLWVKVKRNRWPLFGLFVMGVWCVANAYYMYTGPAECRAHGWKWIQYNGVTGCVYQLPVMR